MGLVIGAQPAAGGAPAQAPTIAVSPSAVPPGGTITVSGNVPADPGGDPCTLPGGMITLTSTADMFPPDGFGPQVALDADGDFETTVTVPATAPPGAYTIRMRCGGSNLSVGAGLQVTAAAPTQPTQPTTGSTAATTTSTSLATSTTSTTSASTTTTSSPTRTSSDGDDDSDGIPWVVPAAIAVLVGAGAAGAVALRRYRQGVQDDSEQPNS